MDALCRWIDDDDGGGDPCSITSLTQPFYITSITQGTNGTTITWQSCPNMIYFVLSAETLQSNTHWAWRTLPMWGQNGSTIWTDSTTTNGSGITSMFYKVGRRPPPIAAGGYHSLAVLTNGTLWAWGGDDQAQLGDGGNSVQVTPEPIGDPLCGPAGLTNPVALAAGYDFSVAVDATGVLWSWGDGGSGQLGNGANANVLMPAPITGISDVVSVAAGSRHTLALRADGTVWACGNDVDYAAENQPGGVLGAGSLYPVTSTNVPIRSLVPTGTVIVAIAAGNYWSLALDTTGQIWGWGDNSNNQIGTWTNSPTLVPGISNVIAIAAGLGHSIAVRADNTLWTWGDNLYDELGRSGITTNPGQVVASGLSNNVVAIAGGNEFTLVVTSNGQVFAFGEWRLIKTSLESASPFVGRNEVFEPVPRTGQRRKVLGPLFQRPGFTSAGTQRHQVTGQIPQEILP
ncbi:MAG: RCC1 domain-containing protein, partial [Verrucomicrobiia bacterium]